MRRIIELLFVSAGVYLLLALLPPRHYPRNGRGTFPILNGSDLFPESLAFNPGENVEAHGYFFGSSSPTTVTLVSGQPTTMYALYLPSPVQEAVACKSEAEVLAVNSSNTTVANFSFSIGTNNSEDSTCPLTPYFAQAGGHLNNPTGYNNDWIPPGQSVDINSVRTDSIFTISLGSCGSIPIQTATFNSGTITLNFAANANVCPSPGVWCSSNPASGSYVQIGGSSNSLLNTPAGTTVGTNLFKVTNITNSSIAFAGSAGQACATNCGTAYGPAAVGAPPYVMPLGFDGVRTATPEIYVQNLGVPNVNVNVNGDVICFPLTAWNLPTFDGSSGLGTGAQGGRNGVMY